ncbi:MAG: hypothetical protein WHV44_14525 [Anaerolineales bacterium]
MKSCRISARATLSIVFAVLFISAACLTPATPPPPPNTPTPTCAPAPSLFDLPSNVYQEYAPGANITPQDALKLLTTQVQRWSATQDITTAMAVYRITVTLISPDVYRAALINAAVHQKLGGATIRDLLRSFDENQQDSGKLRFLVTVSYAQYPNVAPAAQSIYLPVDGMQLLDQNNNALLPSEAEGLFGVPINVVKGPFSGYVTFDLDLNTCSPKLRLDQDTSATLKLEGIRIGDGAPLSEMRWKINLAPVLDVVRPTLAPVPNPPAEPIPNVTPIEPHNTPPRPSTASKAPDAAYWSELARYIWGQLASHAGP